MDGQTDSDKSNTSARWGDEMQQYTPMLFFIFLHFASTLTISIQNVERVNINILL